MRSGGHCEGRTPRQSSLGGCCSAQNQACPTLEHPEALTDLDVASTHRSAATTAKSVMTKLPEVTLAFWTMKVAATTPGENNW